MVNSAVNEKDLIVTGDGASAVMTFTDDSTITLSPKTRLRVKEFGAAGTTGAAGYGRRRRWSGGGLVFRYTPHAHGAYSSLKKVHFQKNNPFY